jgi:hypothetical protein
MKPQAVAAELARLKSMFVLLPETPAIYTIWESLVTRHQVSGKPAAWSPPCKRTVLPLFSPSTDPGLPAIPVSR